MVHQNHRGAVGFIAAWALLVVQVSVCVADGPLPIELPTFRPFVQDDGLVIARLDQNGYRQIASHSNVILKAFPLGDGNVVDLELQQFAVTSPATQIVMGTPEGDLPLPYPDVVLLRGRVAGEENSDVFLGLSPVVSNGFVRRGGREYILTPQRKNALHRVAGGHLVYERSALELENRETPFQCLTPGKADEGAAVAEVASPAGTYRWRVASVAIDCDYEFGQSFDDLAEAPVYAIELLGAVSMIYERDLQVRIHIPYLRIWSTSNDPYTADNVQVLLSDLTWEWKYDMSWVQRDIVHLLSGEPGRAGLAWPDVLCNEDFGYGVSSGLVGAFPRPVPADDSGPDDTWDVNVVAHEMGHQFGSPHTHCYNPPIDYCGQSFDDCWSGTFQCQQGTLMSYCDREECVGAGGGKELRFHERVITRIRQSVDASCLKYGMDPVYIDWTNSTGIEAGSSLFPFNTVLEGLQVVIPGGTLQIDAGVYPEGLVANRPMILRTTGGAVTIGP